MSQLSNVESLLTAIAKGDSSYLVEPQSRVEALLYEIYMSGGGTGDITRAEVLRLLEDKVDKLVGYGLISDQEAERLKNVDNYDDSEVRGLITDISNSIIDLKDAINGTADGQFIYDTEAKMTKVVPENVSKGIVAMIGGKTQKVVQLIDNVKAFSNGSNVDSITEFAPEIHTRINTSTDGVVERIQFTTVTSIGIYQKKFKATQTAGAILVKHNGSTKDINISFNKANIIENHYYIFSLNVKGFNPSVANGLSIENVMLFDITAMGFPDSTTVEQFMSIFHRTYYPYTESSLWNAPVEKITVTGSNLVEKTIKKSSIDNRGIIIDSDGFDSHIAKVISGRKYYINKGGDATVIGFFTSYPSVDSVSYNNSRFVQNASPNVVVVTASITGYMVFRTLPNYANASCVYGETYYPYKEYHKEEIHLPSAILKLPDYGCSAGDVYNYVDFEEMVYHHKAHIVDGEELKKLPWKSADANGRYYTSTAGLNVKPPVANTVIANIECSKYTPDTKNNSTTVDKSISVETTGDLYIKDVAYSGSDKLSSFVSSLANVSMVYELTEEELIPLTDLLLPFKCEPGGTITFENEHNLDVPNTVIYEKEMK